MDVISFEDFTPRQKGQLDEENAGGDGGAGLLDEVDTGPGRSSCGQQVIDDEQGKTLCALSTCSKEARAALTGKKKTEQAAYIGGELAKLAAEAGVKQVVLEMQ